MVKLLGQYGIHNALLLQIDQNLIRFVIFIEMPLAGLKKKALGRKIGVLQALGEVGDKFGYLS